MQRIRWVSVCVLLVAVSGPTVLPADESALKRLADEYDSLLAEGKYGEAVATARRQRQMAEADPNLAGWIAFTHNELGWALLQNREYEEAETWLRKSISRCEREFGLEHADVASVRSNLALLHKARRDWRSAEQELKRALAIREKVFGHDSLELVWTLNELADSACNDERWNEAETWIKRASAIQRSKFPADAPEIGWSEFMHGRLLFGQGKAEEAVTRFGRAKELLVGDGWAESRMNATWSLANALVSAYRQEEAIAEFDEAEALCDRAFKDLPQVRAEILARLLVDRANAVSLTRNFTEAEKLMNQALKLNEQHGGAGSENVGHTMHQFGHLYHDRGQFAEAEQAMRRALKIFRETLGEDNVLTIHLMNDTGHQLAHTGRFVDAEALHLEAIRASERHALPQHLWREVAGLGYLYLVQGRHESAEPMYRRALVLVEQAFGPDSPDASEMRERISETLLGQKKLNEAEAMAKRALAIMEARFGADGLLTVDARDQLARVYLKQKRFEEAERLIRSSIEVISNEFGAESEEAVESETLLIDLFLEQKRYEEAEPLVDRVLSQIEQSQASPAERYSAYTARAEIGWARGYKSDALADLRTAMTLAEQHRIHVSGAEHERARAFEEVSDAFETMVRWQSELGDASEALSAIERGRARSLLDELTLQGADLHAGSTSVEREQLRLREAELAGGMAALEQQLSRLTERGGSEQEQAVLRSKLVAARAALYEFHRDQRSTSPIYRGLLSLGSAPPRLSQVRREALAENELLLEYLIGDEGSYVVAVGMGTDQVLPLTIDDAAARTLGTEPGPLNKDRLNAALADERGTGVLQRIKTARGGMEATAQLAALWRVLVPEPLRLPLTNGDCKRLVVIPDGALTLLPLETLVVSGDAEPRYLLEAGPPVQYAPSVSVLLNLSRRKLGNSALAVPVLTVGSPEYPQRAGDNGRPLLASSTRYAESGGRLAPLPFTKWETSWVDEVFGKRSLGTQKLIAREATEANVRREIEGRTIVHLACHGLADQQFGNFFGSLALTPGPNGDSDPADDGFLTLAEIYDLDLSTCELAILSACDTNYGPQQRGEGVWALSRGFLVAGSRRVVASSWLVDDEAAASQVSLLCGSVAEGMRNGDLDYAQSLHRAKQFIRKQEKWRSPYYWGTFVLIGPK